MNDIQYNLNYARECIETISDNRKSIKELNDLIDENKQVIKDIVNIPEIRNFICNKLQEAIDKFDLNKNKEDNEYNISKVSFCSTGGELEETEHKTINPYSKFNPYKDEWEVVDIKRGLSLEEVKYKIKVENIKGRKHIIAGYCWEPDYYETDWFDFENV